MLRVLATPLVALVCLISEPAVASYSIDLIWADTGTATLTVSPGGPTAASGGNICSDGALSEAGPGRCLRVELTAIIPFRSAVVALGWESDPFGPQVDFAPRRAFGFFSGGGLIPEMVGPIDAAGCSGSGCDTAYGNFGGTSPTPVAAGTYSIGSINLDLSNTFFESGDIFTFLPTGSVFVDGNGVSAPVQINGAFGAPLVNAPPIPEPSTAALLALGTLGLAFAGRPGA